MIKVFSRPPDHHVEISGGPTEVLVDWGHRTTLISSPDIHRRSVNLMNLDANLDAR